MKKHATWVLALLLLLGGGVVLLPTAENAAALVLEPAKIQALYYETVIFLPVRPVLQYENALYLSVEDTAAFLSLAMQETRDGVALDTPAGLLHLDTATGIATLDGKVLEAMRAVPSENDGLYLSFDAASELAQAWYRLDARNHTLYAGSRAGNTYGPKNLRLTAKTRGDQFLYYQNGRWRADTLRGVNLGLTLPGQTVHERSIPYDTYRNWFALMTEMNANALRVYTRQPPAFYRALHDHNRAADKPLWLYQGVWVEQAEALDEATVAEVLQDARELVDIAHGRLGDGYNDDISPWLGGWVIGSEWSANYITATNDDQDFAYEGRYLYTEAGTPAFESRLCAVGDGLIAYQSETYAAQAPVAFVNWSTTDTLKHPSEAEPNQDRASLDTELILPGRSFYPGLFALYHVYPFYPEFISQEAEQDGYKEYLARLYQSHTVPAVVGEYGTSSSRGLTHHGQDGRYRQGGLNETEQGEQIAAMTHSIFDAGFNGALLFTWQDEWFKDSWNTSAQTLPDRSQYWYNAQSSEQSYGLMGAFPGKKRPPIYLDGEHSEWTEQMLVAKTDQGRLYATSDEGYLYLMLRLKDGADTERGLYLPISIDADNGLDGHEGTSFSHPSQFLVVFDGAGGARVLVSPERDAFALLYGDAADVYGGDFGPIRQYLRAAYTRPDTGERIPEDIVETGVLTFGVTNPTAENFNSLADYCRRDDCLELRLPWQLIGFMDPSTLQVLSPLTDSGEISAMPLDQLMVGFGFPGQETIALVEIGLQPWGDTPTWYLRLKDSYFTMQRVFDEYAGLDDAMD